MQSSESADHPTTVSLLQTLIAVKAVAMCVPGVQSTVQGLLLAVLARQITHFVQ